MCLKNILPILGLIFLSPLHADDPPKLNDVPQAYEVFTGQVSKPRVRLRTEPHIESTVVKELNRGDLFLVVDETEDYYAVLPTKGMKAYIYRTFIIDDVVEGNRVNVRLEPSIDSAVIAQLNAGDRVNGKISAQNNRWYEIDAPSASRLYVAKHYIEKVGGADHLEKMGRRQQEVDYLLNTAEAMAKEEWQKPFESIQIGEVKGYLEKIVIDYEEFPQHVMRAKKLAQQVDQEYLKRKIDFLESRLRSNQPVAEEQPTSSIEKEIEFEQDKLSVVTEQIHAIEQQETRERLMDEQLTRGGYEVTPQMATWIPREENLLQEWAEENNKKDPSFQEFYTEQRDEAVILKGSIENYKRDIKNRPGDYLLISSHTHMPIAYLYSTQVNLQENIGRELEMFALKRPNNHFAFPAYFVVEIIEKQSDEEL